MWVSAREASRIFEVEAGLGRQQSRRVLLAGVAGPPTPSGATLVFDAARVHEVARRPELDHGELLTACPSGVFVLRIGRAVAAASGSWRERAAAVSEQRDVGPLARVQVRLRIQEHGPLPFVVTVCGYPVLLAELTDLPPISPGRVRAELAELEPGRPWPALVRAHRLITSPGPPWLLLGRQPFLGRATRRRERPPFPCCRLSPLARPADERTDGRPISPPSPAARPARRRRRPRADGRAGSRRRR